MSNSSFFLVLMSLLAMWSCQVPVTEAPASVTDNPAFSTWETYHGDPTASHFSSLSQINKENVSQLEVAWIFETGDKDERSEIQCNPIIIGRTLYASSPRTKVFALDAATGERQWIFDPFDGGPPSGVNRGVVYWTDGEGDERILFTAGPFLHALNATTGQLIESFGESGKVDMRQGLGRDVSDYYMIATTPGTIYKDLLILGSRVSEGKKAAPGHIRGFDVRTGQPQWIFHTIPHPGEYGYETWPEDAWKEVGGANAWAGFSLDAERGIVFAPTGSPSFDFHGGNRHGDNLFGNSLIALNAETGERIWHFQSVHHDMWDRDLPCQPSLLTVQHNGKYIDAVAQVTKQGLVFVFDRETGEPLFPIEERPIPQSDLKNEQAAYTQPFPLKPAPFARQRFSDELVTDISDEANAFVSNKIADARYGNKFTPPSVEGTIIFPGFDGGADWGGAAVHPTNGILYINASEMPWLLQMVDLDPSKSADTPGRISYTKNCSACHGANLEGQQHVFPGLVGLKEKLTRNETMAFIKNGKGRMPGFGQIPDAEVQQLMAYLYEEENVELDMASLRETESDPDIPYAFTGYNKLFDHEGYPGVKPPWGTLNAIDLNTGEYLWKVVLGEHDALTQRGIPPTGTESYGGPVVTEGGVLFIAGTMDRKFRAFDRDTGEILWETRLPAAGFATPATYEVDGKQYVVIAAGGGKLGTKSGDSYLAFALP
ncbi:MAG: PQQ-binding-like beta-propeller repeat protein [Bacteroidota bacterium]